MAAVDRVFSSGRLILGPSGSDFESRFAEYCGTRFCVGVNSGTDALFLALKALGTGQGHEVITVANTAVPTVAAIRAAGATPVFVDAEEDTFLIDPTLIEAAVTKRTRCILPVHLFGQPADMETIGGISDRCRIPVIEDCAQAAGAAFNGRRVGSLGDLGAFSFYPTKVLGAYGDGGMVSTGQEHLRAKLGRLRFYGMDKAYYSEEEGFNSRLDEVQAAILDFKLQRLDNDVKMRRCIAKQYSEGLAGVGDIATPIVRPDRTHQFYAYTVRTENREELRRYLLEHGIETKINYPVPIHLMRGYSFLGYRSGDLPVTERLADRILSLPLYPGLPESAVEEVIKVINWPPRPTPPCVCLPASPSGARWRKSWAATWSRSRWPPARCRTRTRSRPSPA